MTLARPPFDSLLIFLAGSQPGAFTDPLDLQPSRISMPWITKHSEHMVRLVNCVCMCKVVCKYRRHPDNYADLHRCCSFNYYFCDSKTSKVRQPHKMFQLGVQQAHWKHLYLWHLMVLSLHQCYWGRCRHIGE
jgi:hypothetical protein